MAEPDDTIRRARDVTSMTLSELHEARRTLSSESAQKRPGRLGALTAVERRLSQLSGHQEAGEGGDQLRAAIYSGSTRPPREKKKSGPAIGIAVLIVAVVLGMWLTAGDSEDDTSATPDRTAPSPTAAATSTSSGITESRQKTLAYDACRDAVDVELKAPATAEYPSITAAEFRSDGQAWHVSSYVDAENSFGALLRMTWDCTVKVTADGLVGTPSASLS